MLKQIFTPKIYKLNLLTLIFSAGLSSGCVASSVNNVISAQDNSAPLLPVINVSDLEGKDYTLPQDFTSEQNMIVFGFAHAQQKSVSACVPYLKELNNSYSINYFEVPVIDSKNAILRTIIRNGMRTGITTSEDRKHTLTFFGDKENLLRSLGVKSPDTILVSAINKSGKVIWSKQAECSGELFCELKEALKLTKCSK